MINAVSFILVLSRPSSASLMYCVEYDGSLLAFFWEISGTESYSHKHTRPR
jgi:hypothetical protein